MILTNLHGLSEKRLQALNALGIRRATDLIHFFPRSYLDRTNVQRIGHLSGSGEEVTVKGKVESIGHAGYGKKKRTEVTFSDGSGSLKGVWFRGGSYISRILKEGQTVALFGQVKRYGRDLSMAHPELHSLSNEDDLSEFSRIIPVYPGSKEISKARITSTLIQKWILTILENKDINEFLPDVLLNELSLIKRDSAFQMIHAPENHADHKRALERFKFEELFLFELCMEKVRHRVRVRKRGHVFSDLSGYTSSYFNDLLHFELTDGQKSALRDIRADVRSGSQMNRLIQGDVGAGKTVVAVGAMLMAVDNGFQSALVAPTEILAEQHYRTLSEQLRDTDLNIRLLVGSQSRSLRTDILTDIEGGNCDIVVGTHAVIQDDIRFHKLGLAVIDEQHRFGVKQRAALLEKGDHPHMLVMSATPIPRSLAMTVYADLDISLIKGLPSGRKPVKTAVRMDRKRAQVYDFLKQELADGGQAYVIFPLVEESEALDLKDATAGYEKLKSHFPDFQIGLLHGRMKTDEKDLVMQRFIKNEIQILVSTTVIEVGVDVPNASVMIIEHAERFGLSQLHQLRGRIGRGSRQSYCILIPDVKVSRSGAFRLKTMEETNDGFRIAEADLKLRGPGDFLGTRQSGLPEFRVADIVEDQLLLMQAKEKASELILADPDLSLPEHASLKKVFEPYCRKRTAFYENG